MGASFFCLPSAIVGLLMLFVMKANCALRKVVLTTVSSTPFFFLFFLLAFCFSTAFVPVLLPSSPIASPVHSMPPFYFSRCCCSSLLFRSRTVCLPSCRQRRVLKAQCLSSGGVSFVLCFPCHAAALTTLSLFFQAALQHITVSIGPFLSSNSSSHL